LIKFFDKIEKFYSVAIGHTFLIAEVALFNQMEVGHEAVPRISKSRL